MLDSEISFSPIWSNVQYLAFDIEGLYCWRSVNPGRLKLIFSYYMYDEMSCSPLWSNHNVYSTVTENHKLSVFVYTW
jgi:hypothetical protein